MAPADLVERERELAELSAELDASLGGDGRVLLIEGPAGVGKTRLLLEARSQAADRGARTLIARASQLEREFPFGVVRQLFEAELAEPQLRERALTGAAAPAQAVFSALPDPEQGDGAMDASFAILHGLYWMTLNIAQEQPLVLAIDDLQWSDRPSLRFLTYLARRIEGLSVLAAATVRTGEPPTDEALMGDIGQDPATMYIRPAPLTQAGVVALVTERLGSAESAFAAACHRTTGGNPLLVRQLLSALAAERVEPTAQNAQVVREIGPRAVSRSVLLRLARMPSQTIAVARAVAVLGESAELPTVAALAELPDTQAAGAIATLARAEILRPEAPLGFVHPLVRDAVYHELPPGEREMQHARAARILHEAGAQADQVATHLMAIPRRGDVWVTEVLVEAGRSALRRGATENAVGYLQRALDEPPPDEARPQVLFELGLVEALTNAPAAVEHLQAAYEQAPNAEMKAMSAYALARSLMFADSPTAGVDFARRAREEIPDDFTDVQRSLQALDAIGYWFGAADDTTPRELERYRGEESAGEGPGARMLDAMVAYDLLHNAGHVDDCVRLARRSLDDGTLLEYDNGLFNIPAMIVLTLGDAKDALKYWDEALADAYRQGSMFGKSASDGWRGFTMLHMGELEEADQLLRLAYEGLRAYGYAESVYHYFTAFHTLTSLRRGDLELARWALELVPDLPQAADGPRHWMRAKAELLLAENKPEEALAATVELERRFVERAINPAYWPYRSLRAQALARLDRRDEAITLAEEELELARRFGAPGIVGRSQLTLGQVKGDKEGLDDLREAAEVLERSICQYERARALSAYGGALRRTRHPTEAREPLRRALELAEKCGAPALAEQTRSELYATGARPRTDALSGVEALTASERRVADLAAEGNSNRDIAQALFVTPKTVEVHLSNAYRKLGIRSRRDLPGVLVG